MVGKIKGILVLIFAMFLLFGCDPKTGEGSGNGEGQDTQTPDDGGDTTLDDGGDTQTPENEPDTTPPGEVSNFLVFYENDTVVISWENPSDNDLDFINISYSLESTIGLVPVDSFVHPNAIPGEKVAYYIYNVNTGNSYVFTFCSVDKTGNVSKGVDFEARINIPDTTPPNPVSNVKVTKSGTWDFILTWDNPNDSDLSRVIIGGRCGGGGNHNITCSVSSSAKYGISAIPGTRGEYRQSGYMGCRWYFTLTAVDKNGNESRTVTTASYSW